MFYPVLSDTWEKEVFTVTDPYKQETLCHAKPHSKAPGLAKRQRERVGIETPTVKDC